MPLLSFGQDRRDGTVDGLFSYGVATYTALIIIVNLKVSCFAGSLAILALSLCYKLTLELVCLYQQFSHIQLVPCLTLSYGRVQVVIRASYFTWINIALISLSIACWFPALWGFSHIGALQRTLTDMVELGPHLFSTPAFWLAVICLAPIMALLLDFALSASARQAAPLDRQIFQVWISLLNLHESVCFVGSIGTDTLHLTAWP